MGDGGKYDKLEIIECMKVSRCLPCLTEFPLQVHLTSLEGSTTHKCFRLLPAQLWAWADFFHVLHCRTCQTVAAAHLPKGLVTPVPSNGLLM